MRRLLITLGVVVIGGSSALVGGSLWLDQTPYDDAPASIKACGRTYVNPSDQGIQRRDVDERGLTVQAHVWTWTGKERVWGTAGDPGCGPQVYLQVGDNDFRGYNLSGAP
jgi:hypothetical protein